VKILRQKSLQEYYFCYIVSIKQCITKKQQSHYSRTGCNDDDDEDDDDDDDDDDNDNNNNKGSMSMGEAVPM